MTKIPFHSHSQFDPYILVVVNLIHTINLLTEMLMWQTVHIVGTLKVDKANKK